VIPCGRPLDRQPRRKRVANPVDSPGDRRRFVAVDPRMARPRLQRIDPGSVRGRGADGRSGPTLIGPEGLGL